MKFKIKLTQFDFVTRVSSFLIDGFSQFSTAQLKKGVTLTCFVGVESSPYLIEGFFCFRVDNNLFTSTITASVDNS